MDLTKKYTFKHLSFEKEYSIIIRNNFQGTHLKKEPETRRVKNESRRKSKCRIDYESRPRSRGGCWRKK